MYVDAIPERRYSDSVYWYRLRFYNHTAQEKWVLNLGNVDKATIYTSSLDSLVTGNLITRPERPIWHNKNLIPINIPFGESTHILIKFQNTGTIPLGLTLTPETKIIEVVSTVDLMAGLVKGVFLALLLYNFILTILTRESTFLWITIFLLINNIYLIYYYAKWRVIDIWPGNGYWIVYSESFLYILGLMSFLQFSRAFLKFDKHIDLFIRLILGVGVLLIPLSLTPLLSRVKWMIETWFLLGIVSLTIVVFIQAHGRNIAARYFLISWLTFITLLFIGGLFRMGFMPVVMPGQVWEVWVSLGFVMLSISIAYIYNLQKSQKEHALLAKAKIEREHHNTRNQILADLHDEVTSGLSAIAQMSDLYSVDAHNNGMNKKIGRTARELSESIREVIWGIDPKRDKLSNFVEGLRDAAEILLVGRDIHFNTENLNGMGILGASTRVELYRIYREALHNIVRHSEASKVDIEIKFEEGIFSLDVIDNGKGISPEVKRGYGIDGMYKRARKINGILIVEQGEAEGTKVSLKLKIDAIAS